MKVRSLIDLVASLAMIVAAGVIVWNSGGLRPTRASDPSATPVLPVAPIDIAGIHSRGNSGADVVLLEYSDFECPYCGEAARTTVRELSDYFDSGKVLLLYQHLPLESIHPRALPAAVAAECADKQGQFWGMHDALFADQKALDDASLAAKAHDLGLDDRVFGACQKDPSVPAGVRRRAEEVRKLGVNSTPTMFVGTRAGGSLVKLVGQFPGVRAVPQIRQMLDGLLKDRKLGIAGS